MVTAAPSRHLARRRSRAILVTCCLALFMVTLDNTILNVALPSVQRGLNADVTGLQWTVDAYVLVRGVLLFASGSAGDRFGRRAVFRIGLGVFTLASLACSLSPTLEALVAARCLQAVGGALMTPASLAIITTTFSGAKQRAQAIGVWSATTGLSTAAGPILGGLLVESVGWRSVFWVNVPIGVLALIATRLLPESRAESVRPWDFPGQLLMMVTLGSLTFALIDAPHHGWTATTVLVALVITVLGGIGYVWVEQRRRYPLLELGYFRIPGLAGAVGLGVISFIALGGFMFFNTLYLQLVRGYSPLHAGMLTLPTTLATMFLAPLSGRLTGIRGPRLPACLACVLLATSMGTMAVLIGPNTNIGVLMIGYLLLGCGMGLVNAPATNAAVSSMPPARAGVASAVTSTARQIGTSMGVALLGSVIFSAAGPSGAALGPALSRAAAQSFTSGLHSGYLVACALALAGVALAAWAFRRTSAT